MDRKRNEERSKLEQALLSQLVQRSEEDQDESEEEKSDGRSVGWEGMKRRKRDQSGVKGPKEGAKLTGIEGGRYNVEADGVVGTGRAQQIARRVELERRCWELVSAEDPKKRLKASRVSPCAGVKQERTLTHAESGRIDNADTEVRAAVSQLGADRAGKREKESRAFSATLLLHRNQTQLTSDPPPSRAWGRALEFC